MTKWLERAKREIPKIPDRATAITADRCPTSVTAVSGQGTSENSRASIGSNGSKPAEGLREITPSCSDEGSAILGSMARNLAGRKAAPYPRRGLSPDVEEVPTDEVPPEW